MNITQADVTGLGEKLNALELTDGERALLTQILAAAGEDEVAGFAAMDPFKSFLNVATPMIGNGYGSPSGFAESGKKGEAFVHGFAESGKKADAY